MVFRKSLIVPADCALLPLTRPRICVRKVQVCAAGAHVSLRNKWDLCIAYVPACSNDRRVKPRPYPSLHRVPSIFSTAHQSTLGALRVARLLRAFPFSQVHAQAQQHAINCYLLCFSVACPPSALHPLHIIPLGVSFFALSPGKIHLEIYINIYSTCIQFPRALSTYLPLPPLPLSLPLSALLLKFSICASSPSNRQPPSLSSRSSLHHRRHVLNAKLSGVE